MYTYDALFICFTDTRVFTNDQKTQVYTPWNIERCLTKLNFINHTKSMVGKY